MAKKKHPKLPNGFGSIKKLSGNRTNPYAVYPPTTQFAPNGSPILPKALCYVSDWYTGFYALMEYKNGTFDPDKFSTPEIKDNDKTNDVIAKIISAYNNKTRNEANEKTFAEVYEEFFDYKFNRDKTRSYSKSTIYVTNEAYTNCLALHQKAFRSLKTRDLQQVIDNCPKRHATKEHICYLLNQMYSYAYSHDLCDKMYSHHVKINTPDDDVAGVPFTEDEINLLWNHSANNTVIQGILIMIYSGFRISAYRTLEINKEELYFRGGVKTVSGKNRIVPFCPLIIPFINHDIELFSLTVVKFRQLFMQQLQTIGITGHTPHDCRHTFSWLCDKYNVDRLCKKLMLGHSLGNDVTDLKYGHRTLNELRAEISKIRVD